MGQVTDTNFLFCQDNLHRLNRGDSLSVNKATFIQPSQTQLGQLKKIGISSNMRSMFRRNIS